MPTPQESLESNADWTARHTTQFPGGPAVLAAVRRKCVDCVAGEIDSIATCTITNCALWP